VFQYSTGKAYDALYTILILSDNRRLSLTAAIHPRVWAIG